MTAATLAVVFFVFVTMAMLTVVFVVFVFVAMTMLIVVFVFVTMTMLIVFLVFVISVISVVIILAVPVHKPSAKHSRKQRSNGSYNRKRQSHQRIRGGDGIDTRLRCRNQETCASTVRRARLSETYGCWNHAART